MKLVDYLAENKIPPAVFGRDHGFSKQTLHKYLRGLRFPGPEALRRIHEATNGKVTANDFLDQTRPPRTVASKDSPAEASL